MNTRYKQLKITYNTRAKGRNFKVFASQGYYVLTMREDETIVLQTSPEHCKSTGPIILATITPDGVITLEKDIEPYSEANAVSKLMQCHNRSVSDKNASVRVSFSRGYNQPRWRATKGSKFVSDGLTLSCVSEVPVKRTYIDRTKAKDADVLWKPAYKYAVAMLRMNGYGETIREVRGAIQQELAVFDTQHTHKYHDGTEHTSTVRGSSRVLCRSIGMFPSELLSTDPTTVTDERVMQLAMAMIYNGTNSWGYYQYTSVAADPSTIKSITGSINRTFRKYYLSLLGATKKVQVQVNAPVIKHPEQQREAERNPAELLAA